MSPKDDLLENLMNDISKLYDILTDFRSTKDNSRFKYWMDYKIMWYANSPLVCREIAFFIVNQCIGL